MAMIFASETPARAARASTTGTHGKRRSRHEEGLATLQSRADGSPATARLAGLQAGVAQRLEEEEPLQGKAIQRLEEEELMQGKAIQRMEEEEPLQGKALQRLEDEEPLQGKGATVQRQGGGGSALPASLQQGIRQLSGNDVSDVNVHYNSTAPAQVGAHAYAQGNDIHLASGQEKHLPHEAWHVVQQREGRVRPTVSVAGTPVNDDPGLEREADVMGAKAAQPVPAARLT